MRKAMAKFRTSCHSLKIETGRHAKPPMPRNQRLCTSCNVVEDELHFLITCKKYNMERNNLFSDVHISTFKHWTEQDKFNYLMSSKNAKLVRNVAAFIQKNLFT